MAEGLLLVLVGDEVNKKEEYLALNKVYEFEVLFGFGTDTHDALGAIDCKKKFSGKLPTKVLKKYIGRQSQKYPIYSSKTVNGIPLWKLAREGKIEEENIPQHEIEIYELEIVAEARVSSQELLDRVLNNIANVNGDFRQKEISDLWKDALVDNSFHNIIKFRAKVSSGTYIRTLAQDIGKELETCALALSIKRLSVGDFS